VSLGEEKGDVQKLLPESADARVQLDSYSMPLSMADGIRSTISGETRYSEMRGVKKAQ
jgi:hypothetical protein